MLTADLVRARVVKGEVRPQYLAADDEEALLLAASLIERFKDAVGRTRGHLDRELKEELGVGTEFLLHRGLAKLLLDRCEFETQSERDPEEIRRAAFLAAAQLHRTAGHERIDRDAALAAAATSLGMPCDEVARSLFADLKDEQRIAVFEECTAAWLVERYNLALAQAILLRASAMTVHIPPQPQRALRRLFQRIKFHQLLYRVDGSAAQGYELTLAGPLSMLRSTQRYGVQFALFLPELLELKGFTAEAQVVFGRGREERRFRVGEQTGLQRPRLTAKGFTPPELEFLPIQFRKLKTDWQIEDAAEVIDLGGRGVLVPDHRFVHPPTGVTVYLEILGFWRRGALESHLERLRAHGPRNLVLAIGHGLNVGEDDAGELPWNIHRFRSAPIAREILPLLDRFLTDGEPPARKRRAAKG